METKHYSQKVILKLFSLLVITCLLLPAIPVSPASASAGQSLLLLENPNPPSSPVKLIFIHHSTGENWLADDNGGLGLKLSQNNYFVSDTNYGWGPKAIGDRTDIPNWLEWFKSSSTATNMSALYAESGQHASYTRTVSNPGGQNTIVMFKSCFPNSALEGNPTDPPSSSGWLTVGHAKYVYNQLLTYFQAHPDKLFVVITAPPLSDPTYAANARAFNQWLVNNWLSENNYTLPNVAVFDFYNVLTSNGGDAGTNDLGSVDGNHHRWYSSAIQHKTDAGSDTLAYPSGDDHPSQAGNLKASAEFLPLLNIFYNRWKSSPAPHTISGNVGIASGKLTYLDGTTKTVTADGKGLYSFSVPYNWSGTVTPTKTGIDSFNPASISYSSVIANQTNQNYKPIRSLSLISNSADDGSIRETGENTTKGGVINASAATFLVGDAGDNTQYRAVLSFDTSALPDNAKIQAVKLKLTLKTLTGSDPFASLGSLLIDIRKPNFGSARKLEANDFAASPNLSAAGSILKPDSGSVYTGTLLAAAYPSINLTGRTQLRLRFATDDNNNLIADTLAFCSGNETVKASQPVLQIFYTTP